ncbi:MAG: hypothetical protein H6747_12365 [Deltaproteobacteria bacterium]|nr:hypothetical protein [Deltaproteobacteria bacterium]
MAGMPVKFLTEDVLSKLRPFPELAHLRVRPHGETLVIESGPDDDPIRHARLRRQTVHLWTLDVADHRGRWQPTPFRDRLHSVVELLLGQFGWVLEDRLGDGAEPGRDLGS